MRHIHPHNKNTVKDTFQSHPNQTTADASPRKPELAVSCPRTENNCHSCCWILISHLSTNYMSCGLMLRMLATQLSEHRNRGITVCSLASSIAVK